MPLVIAISVNDFLTDTLNAVTAKAVEPQKKDNAACKVDCKDAKNKDNAACKPAAKK